MSNEIKTNIPFPPELPIEDVSLPDSQSIQKAEPELAGLFHAEELSLSFIGKPAAALAKARTRGKINQITKDSITIGDDITIRFSRAKMPGAGETKLLRYGVSALTKVNAPFAKHPTMRVYGDTKDFARACIKDPARGIDPRKMSTPEEQEKENARAAKALENFVTKIAKNARSLQDSLKFDFVASFKGKERRYGGLVMLGAYNIDSSVIMLEFTQSAAEYFTRQPLTTIPRAFYAIDEHKPNALAIADELIRQYGNENNVLRNTEGVLKVETLLKATSLPTIDELVGKGSKNKAGEKTTRSYRYRWEERIKEPFEQALDECCQKHLIKDWHYCLANKKPIPDDASILFYEQFLSLYVRFELCGYDSHADRAKHVAGKREAQKNRTAAKQKKQKASSK